jgi:hypothetical protein
MILKKKMEEKLIENLTKNRIIIYIKLFKESFSFILIIINKNLCTKITSN